MSASVSAILFNSDTQRVEVFPAQQGRADRIAFLFNPHSNRDLAGNRYGGELLCRHGYDVVAFKTIACDWYQSLPQAVLDQVAAIARSRTYRWRVAYGSSMGGYAAIAFSGQLGCDRVLALSPQYRIDDDFDRRWSYFAAQPEWRYRIAAETVNAQCTYVLAYDSRDIDAAHVDLLESILPAGRLTRLPLPFAGHPVADYLAETGHIQDLALAALGGAPLDGPRYRRGKASSASYAFNLADKLLAYGKPARSLAVSAAACQRYPASARLHRARSQALDRLGRMNEAIVAAWESLRLEPADAGTLNHLADLEARSGRTDSALQRVRQALALPFQHDNPHLLAHCAILSLQTGALDEASTAIERALAIDPSVSGFHFYQSLIAERCGDPTQALYAAQRAWELEPANIHIETLRRRLLHGSPKRR